MMGRVAHYVKSHGLGNDYIVIDPAKVPFAVTPEAVRLICDRHRGVGSDGILLVAAGDGTDFGVRIFNPDGSEAEKSGNGARIFAKFLRDHGYTDKERFTLDTLRGRVTCALEREGGREARRSTMYRQGPRRRDMHARIGRVYLHRRPEPEPTAPPRQPLAQIGPGEQHRERAAPDVHRLVVGDRASRG